MEAEFHGELQGAREDADPAALQRIKSTYFGPKGKVTLLARGVGQLPPEERPAAGKEINRVRQVLEGALDEVIARVEASARERELRRSRLDLSLPGRAAHPRGAIHPVHRVIYEMTDVFARMGFEVATGPEVELDFYNFEALNFPKDHPARDMQDTFFVRPPDERSIKDLLLRTHTSPVQTRALESRGVPIRIISPGRVFRCDSDATHSPMFHQIEVLCVDEGISFAHLKGVLTSFLNAFFGNRRVRFRPSFFPFVEPGTEVDMECVMCGGAGCRLCKGTGWMEILGAGMVHPAVLEACGVDSERYTGFAAGLGIDRIAMLRWRIDDLGHLFKSDVRFLGQL
ncbi:phenylalanine--tRNA ligase subunit alpha [Myxococcota bacterium]|nr:phenylalanine--tRNA ligase subunit alpha [Myxococcota bacterium]